MSKSLRNDTNACPWPIGSHLFNDGQNPGEIWAGTVWEQIKERFPLGCGDTHKAGSMGGEFEHALTYMEMPTHNHIQRKEMPNKGIADIVRQYKNGGDNGDTLGPQVTWLTGRESLCTSNAGGDIPHNNTPPITRCTGGIARPECEGGVTA